jgi:hypothetical protein
VFAQPLAVENFWPSRDKDDNITQNADNIRLGHNSDKKLGVGGPYGPQVYCRRSAGDSYGVKWQHR